ncbi:uncharacterized protein [Venturia canescens]|uniref:uncharacterized protein n=1 Tax=Venturia canescens TaxID=32260 RepID=UPI001C9C352C|nr:uncharacterized protein LOC122412320 [Venturia canescens]
MRGNLIRDKISSFNPASITAPPHKATRTDLRQCKLSHFGTEYQGEKGTTAGGIRCQSWSTKNPVHKISSKIKSTNFPERSMKMAKNYCRNPTNDPKGPWCYSMDPSLIDDDCGIPLCNYGECRISGTGAEYGGTKKDNLITYNPFTSLKTKKFPNQNFPELSRNKAKAFCRNPTDDPGGPWCYVEDENLETVGKQYCDVPFCDDKGPRRFTGSNAEARLLLSLLPIPTSARKIAQDWRAGVEIVISNKGSGQALPSVGDEQDFKKTPNIVLCSKWTGLWINWGGGFISVGLHGASRPLFTDEYKKKNTISRLYLDSFLYYGLMGTGVLWSTEFCQEKCEVHTTFGADYLRMWPLQPRNTTYDVRFHVRASNNAIINLYKSPGFLFPSYAITIGKAHTVTLTYQKSEKSTKQHLKDVPAKGLLDFWVWKEFSISIFGPHLQLFAEHAHRSEEIFYFKDHAFAAIRWFSVGSPNNVAMWTFFCSPEPVEPPTPPNCITNLDDYNYRGFQWTSVNELPCAPWISSEVPDDDKKNKLFIDRSALKALSKCRNPGRDPKGPYCYSMTLEDPSTLSKQYCPIRSCRSLECRMAGTANDYIGKLSTTRSGRTCAKWMNRYAIHPVNPQYLNDSLYPEGSVRNASNYCRDPSRDIAGTWCYTTDPLVPQDLCDIRDCDMPEECTFFVRGTGLGRRLYVLPEHRTEGLKFSLKAWEPDQPDSITFVFTAEDGLKSRYILKVGAVDNEKVALYYESEEGDIKLVKETTLPHLIYLGKWSTFIIKVPRGHVMLYYEGAPYPLFQWDHPDPALAFYPVYYYYTSELGRAIGVSFDCDTRCHIENTKIDRITRILPLSAWSKSAIANPDRLVLMVRAEGVILIPLLLFPGAEGYYAVRVGEAGRSVQFVKQTYPNLNTYHKKKSVAPLFDVKTWTNITLWWRNSTIDVFRNGTSVFHYQHTHPLLFYFFSIIVENGGWVTWVANCLPADIDGDPVDGGWSEWGPWACSASCDGGVGIRKRVCNNPVPNVKGEPCLGPDAMSGRCNTILCGDITEDTVKFIKRRIRRNHTMLSVREGRQVTIPSDPDLTAAIKTESPDSEFRWSRNGIFLDAETRRMKIVADDIVIKSARTDDSGVYTLTFLRVDGRHMILKMASLVVYPVKTVVTLRETLPMSLICHAVTLGYLYADLKISWSLGNATWKNYGITLPITVNLDSIPAVNRSHAGLWKCHVEQEDLGFEWITNAILVEVIGPPNWRTYLMEDELTRPIFGWVPNETFAAVLALVIFLLLTACIIVVIGFCARFRKSGKYRGPIERKVPISELKRVPVPKDQSKRWKFRSNRESSKENIGSSKPGKSKFRRSEEIEEEKLIGNSETDESP